MSLPDPCAAAARELLAEARRRGYRLASVAVGAHASGEAVTYTVDVDLGRHASGSRRGGVSLGRPVLRDAITAAWSVLGWRLP